jgi:hypothetical protein
MPAERHLTTGPRILTHANVWSPCGQWIVYDNRSDAAGTNFDGTSIERVHLETGRIETLYTSQNQAHCGVASYFPDEDKILFILGPEHPTVEWSYGPAQRQGVIVDVRQPGVAIPLDARDLVPPFTSGALAGGSHVHIKHPTLPLVSFTYDDHLFPTRQRTVAVAELGKPVTVPKSHARNHDGSAYSTIVTHTVEQPTPGSDEISRACEEAWIGTSSSLAFQGDVRTEAGETHREVFRMDLVSGQQTRLTRTEHHRYPGIAGPRHWLKSSPKGDKIGFLKRDDAGIVQFWTVSPDGGEAVQVSHLPCDVASAFSWHPSCAFVAFHAAESVCVLDVATGQVRSITTASPGLRPEACVFSPDGTRIAYVRLVEGRNTITVVEFAG